MELVNTTPVPAAINVVSVPGKVERRGVVTAKASFRLGPSGAELDVESPLPLFADDQPTAVGLLPRDDIPRRDGRCEVILLGAAHAGSIAPVEQMTVELSIGALRRRLAVFGDRTWEGAGAAARIGRPEPFQRMPLVWERAFGGSAEVLVDEDSPIDLADPRNPYGKGFDARRPAEELCRAWKAPPAYPILSSGLRVATSAPDAPNPLIEPARRLPNIEDPEALIASWDDAPEPACWATAPVGIDLHLLRELTRSGERDVPPVDELSQHLARRRLHHRCHPDLLMDVPAPGTPIQALGVRPMGEPFKLTLPDVRVFADYVVGGYRGTRQLSMETLVLLPEERRFYMVLRHAFTVPYRPGEERAMRLRVEIASGGKKS